MPEEVSTPPHSPSLTYSEPRVAEPWSIESEADHLMEHLFTDVDLMLDGGSQLPTKPAQADFIALQTVVPAPLQVETQPLAPGLQPSPSLQPQRQSQPAPPPAATPPKLQQRLWSHLDWLLFAIACLSFLGVFAWLVSQGKFNGLRFQPSPSSQGVPEGAIATLPPEDAAFGQYMLRSMRAISRRPPQSYALNPNNQERDVEELAAAAPRGEQSNPQVIERIYLPVYPPNAPPRETAAAAPAPSPPAPAPTVAPRPAPSPSAVQPPPTPSTQATIPPPPQQPSLAWREMLPTVPPLDQEPAAAPVAPLPPGDHKLVGILEDGTRSTALFTIGEINHRVSPGEPIGESGWVLVDTEGRQATVRRNGEVRSVYIGQPF